MHREFQVVLLASAHGDDLEPMTDHIPKLEFLESAGFEEVFVVTSSGRNHGAIEDYLAESYRGKLKATLLAFDPSLGSAELLLKLRDRLVSDFIVLSGDLVVSEPRQFLHRLADTHRTKSAAITALAYRARSDSLPDADAAISVSQSAPAAAAAASASAAVSTSSSSSGRKRGGKANAAKGQRGGAANAAEASAKDAAKAPKPSMYLGIAAPNNRLAMYVNADDVDDGDVIVLRKALLRLVPRLAIRSDLVDAHLYIVSHWTLSLLPEIVSKGMVSLQADLLPIMVRGQFVRAWRERAAAILRNDPRTLYDTSADVDADAIKCFIHVLDDAHYCRRVQTLNDFILVNRDVAAHKGQTGYRPAGAAQQGQQFCRRQHDNRPAGARRRRLRGGRRHVDWRRQRGGVQQCRRALQDWRQRQDRQLGAARPRDNRGQHDGAQQHCVQQLVRAQRLHGEGLHDRRVV